MWKRTPAASGVPSARTDTTAGVTARAIEWNPRLSSSRGATSLRWGSCSRIALASTPAAWLPPVHSSPEAVSSPNAKATAAAPSALSFARRGSIRPTQYSRV